MGTHPSKRFEDGVLVERAIDTNEPGEPNESEPTVTKPYRVPLVTPRSPEDRERYQAERAPLYDEKAVQEAENKAVASAETKPRKRAAKK